MKLDLRDPKLASPIVLVLVAGLLVARQATCGGLGDEVIWRRGTLLDEEMNQENGDELDTMFKSAPISPQLDGADDELVGKLIGQVNVDVVAPRKPLYDMMNLVSTRSRAYFLSKFKEYFGERNIGSTSRPMLMAFLGLELVQREQIASWYKQATRGRHQRQIVDSCLSLLAKWKESTGGNTLAELKCIEEPLRGEDSPFRRSFLVQQSNPNLFMLESYLILCNKLEPEKLSAAFGGTCLISTSSLLSAAN